MPKRPFLLALAALTLCGASALASSSPLPTARQLPQAGLEASSRPVRQGVDNAWALPPLVRKDLSGVERNLYDWHGRVILLNFWATWCAPCQMEIPNLMDYQARYGDQGLQVVSVGMDEARKLKNFVRSVGINYPVLVAAQRSDLDLLRTWGNAQGILPYSVIIDRDGHLVFSRAGIFDDEAFETYVMPLLQPAATQSSRLRIR